MGPDIQTLRESFRRLAPRADILARSFYDTLFARFPELRALFEDVRLDEQHRKLTRGLELIVRHIERPEFMRPYLHGLGALHVAYGVTPEHYPVFGDCLLVALRETVGPAWSEREERAWRGAVELISDAMLAGAAQVTPIA